MVPSVDLAKISKITYDPKVDAPVLNELNLTKKRVRAEDMGVLMGGLSPDPTKTMPSKKELFLT